MLFLEEWEVVQKLKDKKSESEIASTINRSVQTVNNYANYSKDEILDKLKMRLYSKKKPCDIKPSGIVPNIFVTKNGEFVYKAKKYWYKKNTTLTTSARGEINQVSFYWEGTYYRAHRIIAEALFPEYSKDKFVLFKDGNKLNIHPSNLILSDSKNIHRCKSCNKPIRKSGYCSNCRKKNEKSQIKSERNKELAKQLEDGIKENHISIHNHQRLILSYLKDGYGMSQIAKELKVSRQSVFSSIKRLKIRVGVR